MRCLFLQRRDFSYYPLLEQALRAHGVELLPAFFDREPDMKEVASLFQQWQPDFLFSHPTFLPFISYLARVKGVPYIHWEVDKLINPRILAFEYTATDHFFTTYREDVARLAQVGATAYYLPNAWNIDPAIDRAAGDFQYEVSFVGTAEAGVNNYYRNLLRDTDAKAVHWPEPVQKAWRQAKQGLEELLSVQFQASQRHHNRLPELIEAEYRQRQATYQAFQVTPGDLFMLLTKETAHRQRCHFLKGVTRLDAFGPVDWEKLRQELPGMVYHGPVRQFDQSGPVFARSRINLSLARVYARDGLSDRIFNVLRAGGLLLADRQPPLLELFRDGEELVTYDSREEMVDKIRHFLDHPEEARRIARAGQARVRAGHGFHNRVGEILARVFA
ncbi:MAG: glycosyltransferase [Magnetococcales bacterium]|nr:glycosyltransferase [Magnetococcales bacterium]